MTGAEFKSALRRLGRTQIGFAREIGVSRRSVHLWVEQGPPAYVVYLINLIERYVMATSQLPRPEQSSPDPTEALCAMYSIVESGGARLEFLGAVERWLKSQR